MGGDFHSRCAVAWKISVTRGYRYSSRPGRKNSGPVCGERKFPLASTRASFCGAKFFVRILARGMCACHPYRVHSNLPRKPLQPSPAVRMVMAFRVSTHRILLPCFISFFLWLPSLDHHLTPSPPPILSLRFPNRIRHLATTPSLTFERRPSVLSFGP